MRHGQDDETRVGGWSDVDLTLCGMKQANVAGMYLKDLEIEQIISSDLKRCITTSKIVNNHLQKKVTLDSRLREQNKGDLNGMTLEKAEKEYPEYIHKPKIDMVYPNGESLIDLYNRIKKLMPWILNQDKTLLITHRGVINMLYYILENKKLDENKTQFGVTHASIHELEPKKLLIRRK